MATNPQRPYRSYLLRLRQIYQDGHPTWRASLESAQTGEVVHFADLLALLIYLAQQVQDADHRDEEEVLNRLFQDW